LQRLQNAAFWLFLGVKRADAQQPTLSKDLCKAFSDRSEDDLPVISNKVLTFL
jgi:hypothetical protein